MTSLFDHGSLMNAVEKIDTFYRQEVWNGDRFGNLLNNFVNVNRYRENRVTLDHVRTNPKFTFVLNIKT